MKLLDLQREGHPIHSGGLECSECIILKHYNEFEIFLYLRFHPRRKNLPETLKKLIERFFRYIFLYGINMLNLEYS